MAKTHDFQDKPIFLMHSWKLALLDRKDMLKAEELCQQALTFCDLTNQTILKSRLEIEWQNDLKQLELQ